MGGASIHRHHRSRLEEGIADFYNNCRDKIKGDLEQIKENKLETSGVVGMGLATALLGASLYFAVQVIPYNREESYSQEANKIYIENKIRYKSEREKLIREAYISSGLSAASIILSALVLSHSQKRKNLARQLTN